MSPSLGTYAKKAAFLDWLKRAPCADCKQAYPTVCMQFDHVRGDKVAAVSTLRSQAGWEQLIDELMKCEIVCANCHFIRTDARGQWCKKGK